MEKILALLLVFSCGRVKPADVEPVAPSDPLKEKATYYIENMQFDAYGWIEPECDGLLFNSLARVTGIPIDVYKAEQAPGKWRRHPNFDRCKPGHGSASEISRDMFRGLFIVLLLEKNRDALKRIHDYGRDNAWIMGEGDIARTWFNPLIRNQLKRMLQIEQDPELVSLPGYEGHLRVLSIFTEFLISGYLLDAEAKELHNYARENPRNTLYQIMSSKFSGKEPDLTTLYDDVLFPLGPITDQNRYTHYLWQRDNGPDWEPCGSSEKRPCESITHTGLDYLFAMWLLQTDFRSLR